MTPRSSLHLHLSWLLLLVGCLKAPQANSNSVPWGVSPFCSWRLLILCDLHLSHKLVCRHHRQPHARPHFRGHSAHRPGCQQLHHFHRPHQLPLWGHRQPSLCACSAIRSTGLCLPGTSQPQSRPSQPQHLARWERQLAASRQIYLHCTPTPASSAPHCSPSTGLSCKSSSEPYRAGSLPTRWVDGHRTLPAQPAGPVRRLRTPHQQLSRSSSCPTAQPCPSTINSRL